MKPLHLLITDDDPDKRMLLSRAVVREFPHASVFECHSGQEALDYCRRNVVDAIVTNHNMYPVNGIELVTTLRRGGSKVPIIMVSGHPMAELSLFTVSRAEALVADGPAGVAAAGLLHH